VNENLITAIITAIVGVSATLGTMYAARGQIMRKEEENELASQKIIFDNAIALHEAYRLENEKLRERIATLTNELADMRRACNRIGQENARLRERVAKLEARLDTGELTPPTHDISGFTEPPPPDGNDPADWE